MRYGSRSSADSAAGEVRSREESRTFMAHTLLLRRMKPIAHVRLQIGDRPMAGSCTALWKLSMIGAGCRSRLDRSRHPVHARFFVPFRRHLLRLRPELDRAAAGDVADAELRFVPAAEAEWLAWHGDTDVHADH